MSRTITGFLVFFFLHLNDNCLCAQLSREVNRHENFENIQNRNSEIEKIDRQIEELSDEKQRHEAAAFYYREEADRWQFYPGRLQDARNSFERQAEEEERARALQRKIDQLKKRREELLQNEKNLQ
jgi:hypothetical protein